MLFQSIRFSSLLLLRRKKQYIKIKTLSHRQWSVLMFAYCLYGPRFYPITMHIQIFPTFSLLSQVMIPRKLPTPTSKDCPLQRLLPKELNFIPFTINLLWQGAIIFLAVLRWYRYRRLPSNFLCTSD